MLPQMPEPTAVTRIPYCASASAAAFVSWFIPPFDTQYAGKLATARLALIKDVFTKAPGILCPLIVCVARRVATQRAFQ